MKLFVNGCSHTEGTDLALDGDLTKAWPYKLQRFMGFDELHNKSCAGVSNERIVRTTIEEISLSSILPDLAVIQFTDPYRFEIPDEEINGFFTVIPHVYQKPEYRDVIKNNKLEIELCNKHYNINSKRQKLLLHDKFITQLLSLQNLFQNYNIPYIFIVWWEPDQFIQNSNLFKVLDKSRVLNYDDSIVSMDKILQSHGYSLCNKTRIDGTLDKHYQEDAQEFIAHSIQSFVNDGYHLLENGKTNYEEVVHHYG